MFQFYTREETQKEVTIVMKTTPWQMYTNVFFIVLVGGLRLGGAFLQYQNLQKTIIDEKFIYLILCLVGVWIVLGCIFTLGNRKAVKEINTAVKKGLTVNSSGSPWSIKSPRKLVIEKNPQNI